MDDVPYVWLADKSYENVVAICPFCENRNVFNRKSDLRDIYPIAYKEVQCLKSSCQKTFRINGDIINPAYEILIFDCAKLKEEKRYSSCILNVAQSLEMFFALYLRVYLLYRPFAQEETYDLVRLNKASAHLTKKTKDLAFSTMRALFLNHIILTKVLMKRNAVSLDEAETILTQLHTGSPSHNSLLQVPDARFADMLVKVNDTDIGSMRNKVVHKSGYRPSLVEVEDAISEVQRIEYGLLPFLGHLTDSVDMYRAVTKS